MINVNQIRYSKYFDYITRIANLNLYIDFKRSMYALYSALIIEILQK